MSKLRMNDSANICPQIERFFVLKNPSAHPQAFVNSVSCKLFPVLVHEVGINVGRLPHAAKRLYINFSSLPLRTATKGERPPNGSLSLHFATALYTAMRVTTSLYTVCWREPMAAMRQAYSLPLTNPLNRYFTEVPATVFHWLASVSGVSLISYR